MRKFAVLIALLVVVLAGCRVESNIILDINEDGSAIVGAEIGFDEEFQALMADGGADPADMFGDLPTIGDDVITTERTEGDMSFVGVESNVEDLTTFSASQGELDSFTEFSYEFDDESAKLFAVVSTAETDLGGGELEELGFDPSQLTDDFFSANVVVTMPGEVTEHNADVVPFRRHARMDHPVEWFEGDQGDLHVRIELVEPPADRVGRARRARHHDRHRVRAFQSEEVGAGPRSCRGGTRIGRGGRDTRDDRHRGCRGRDRRGCRGSGRHDLNGDEPIRALDHTDAGLAIVGVLDE